MVAEGLRRRMSSTRAVSLPPKTHTSPSTRTHSTRPNTREWTKSSHHANRTTPPRARSPAVVVSLGPYAYVVRQPPPTQLRDITTPVKSETHTPVRQSKSRPQQSEPQAMKRCHAPPVWENTERNREKEEEKEKEEEEEDIFWTSPVLPERLDTAKPREVRSGVLFQSHEGTIATPRSAPKPKHSSSSRSHNRISVPSVQQATSNPSHALKEEVKSADTTLVAELLRRIRREWKDEVTPLPFTGHTRNARSSLPRRTPHRMVSAPTRDSHKKQPKKEGKDAHNKTEKEKEEEPPSRRNHSFMYTDIDESFPADRDERRAARHRRNEALRFLGIDDTSEEVLFTESSISERPLRVPSSSVETGEWASRLWDHIEADDTRMCRWLADRGMMPSDETLALHVLVDHLKRKSGRLEKELEELFWSSRYQENPTARAAPRAQLDDPLNGLHHGQNHANRALHPYGGEAPQERPSSEKINDSHDLRQIIYSNNSIQQVPPNGESTRQRGQQQRPPQQRHEETQHQSGHVSRRQSPSGSKRQRVTRDPSQFYTGRSLAATTRERRDRPSSSASRSLSLSSSSTSPPSPMSQAALFTTHGRKGDPSKSTQSRGDRETGREKHVKSPMRSPSPPTATRGTIETLSPPPPPPSVPPPAHATRFGKGYSFGYDKERTNHNDAPHGAETEKHDARMDSYPPFRDTTVFHGKTSTWNATHTPPPFEPPEGAVTSSFPPRNFYATPSVPPPVSSRTHDDIVQTPFASTPPPPGALIHPIQLPDLGNVQNLDEIQRLRRYGHTLESSRASLVAAQQPRTPSKEEKSIQTPLSGRSGAHTPSLTPPPSSFAPILQTAESISGSVGFRSSRYISPMPMEVHSVKVHGVEEEMNAARSRTLSHMSSRNASVLHTPSTHKDDSPNHFSHLVWHSPRSFEKKEEGMKKTKKDEAKEKQLVSPPKPESRVEAEDVSPSRSKRSIRSPNTEFPLHQTTPPRDGRYDFRAAGGTSREGSPFWSADCVTADELAGTSPIHSGNRTAAPSASRDRVSPEMTSPEEELTERRPSPHTHRSHSPFMSNQPNPQQQQQQQQLQHAYEPISAREGEGEDAVLPHPSLKTPKRHLKSKQRPQREKGAKKSPPIQPSIRSPFSDRTGTVTWSGSSSETDNDTPPRQTATRTTSYGIKKGETDEQIGKSSHLPYRPKRASNVQFINANRFGLMADDAFHPHHTPLLRVPAEMNRSRTGSSGGHPSPHSSMACVGAESGVSSVHTSGVFVRVISPGRSRPNGEEQSRSVDRPREDSSGHRRFGLR